MIKNISWSEYLVAVGFLSAVYYLIVGIRYFSDDIRQLLPGKRKVRTVAPAGSNNSQSYLAEKQQNNREIHGLDDTSDDEFTAVKTLIDRLITAIEDASARRLIPQEFRQYLCNILKKYPSLKDSPFQSSVNNLIVSECQKYEGVILTIEDVETLWMDVGVTTG